MYPNDEMSLCVARNVERGALKKCVIIVEPDIEKRLFAKIGVDKAEIWPSQVCRHIHTTPLPHEGHKFRSAYPLSACMPCFPLPEPA